VGLRLPFLLCAVALAVIGCGAAAPFGYRYYGLKPDSYRGTLEGPDASKDLPLSVCAPDAKDKNKCVVMLTQEAFRLKAEVLQLRQQLKDCQRGI
jgi:hypothetical protein